MSREKKPTTTPPENPNAFSRRRFIQGSVAAAAGVLSLNQNSPIEAAQSQNQPNAFKGRRPNFLILMCDEMRFPPVYESAETKNSVNSI